MGAEFQGYATDITRSYPVNGKFTPDQAVVHNAVYEAQQAVLKALKPGVLFPDMHKLAEKIIITHLREVRTLSPRACTRARKDAMAAVTRMMCRIARDFICVA